LNLSVGYTPAVGTQFTILTAGSISGTFSGVADGDTVTADGVSFRVNYTATTVVLTTLGGTAETIPAPSSSGGMLAATGAPIAVTLAVIAMLLCTGFVLKRRRVNL
jgi:hypothetical protein